MPPYFCQAKKPIFISLSPNVEKDDIQLALRLLFRSWRKEIIINQQNQHQSVVSQLEQKFRQLLGVKYVFAFNSGRSAFLAILAGLGFKGGDEILLQAFTCNAAVNPIIWSGLKPVFVDIERETLNIDPKDFEAKITPRTRAVLVQHTFGLPAKLQEIQEICARHDLILIEDCAHALGAKYDGRLAGSFGRAAFFSFGRDKVISSVYGGMAVTSDDTLAARIREFQQACLIPSSFWTLQQLLHPILTHYLVIPLYRLGELGRWFLLFLQKTKVLSKAVHKKEKRGERPDYFPRRMPEELAVLALNQFQKLARFLRHQKEIADFYSQSLKDDKLTLPFRQEERIYMRYPVLVDNTGTDKILEKARQKKIFLDDGWRKQPIVPPDTNQINLGYKKDSCPQAEKTAQEILNLPTHINISENEARRITELLKAFKK